MAGSPAAAGLEFVFTRATNQAYSPAPLRQVSALQPNLTMFRMQPSLVLCAVCVWAALAHADDFRVDSKVFVGKESTPRSTNVTLFQGTHVYDFLDSPRQITFYDLDRGRIVLLSPDANAKVEVSKNMLDAFCNSLKHLQHKADDPVLSFALSPQFVEREEKSSDERVFTSKHLTYRVTTMKGLSDGMASQYRAFSDASARLNAMVNRGSLPPFPRMAINEALDASRDLPVKVQFTASSGRLIGGRTVALKSEHEFRARLLDSDLQRIDEAGNLLSGATAVGLTEFLGPGKAAIK